ncbi:MAG: hypothetical protein WA778_10590, partial [Pseudolabrys sp.]
MRAHFRLSDNPDDRQDSDCDNQQGGRRTYIATRGSFEEGAPAALLIVAVGILPIIWIVRQAEMSPHSGGNRENPD